MKNYWIKTKKYNFKVSTNDNDVITAIHFTKGNKESSQLPKNISLLKNDLISYFKGKKTRFRSKVLLPKNTAFTDKVYQRMQAIPYGKTMTYQDLATASGSSKAQRAIGSICAKNPLPILIPCHRVVGKNSLGGFAFGLNTKRSLLDLESSK